MDEEIQEIRQLENDPAEQARKISDLLPVLQSTTTELSRIRREAVQRLVESGQSYAQIAAALGMSKARVGQIIGGLPPERTLLAPNAPAGAPLTVMFVQRREAELGHAAIVESTRLAIDKLKQATAGMDLQITLDPVPIGGDFIDLNRDQLAVLVGPRVSPLIAQAITADPVIKWRRDQAGWYLVDTEDGTEHHSDFDQAGPGVAGSCIAHIGRIRRPDGDGSFLYLGGAHAAGTAGAVEVLVRELLSLWEQTRRASSWSAIVTTKVDEAGEIVSAQLASPVYTHGKR